MKHAARVALDRRDALADAHALLCDTARAARSAGAARARAPSPRSLASVARVVNERRETLRGAPDPAHREHVEMLAPDAEHRRLAPVGDPDAPRRGRAVLGELVGGVEEAVGADGGPQLPRLELGCLAGSRPHDRTAHERADREPRAGREQQRRESEPHGALGRAERQARAHECARHDADREHRGDPPVDVAEGACVIVPGIARMVIASRHVAIARLMSNAEPAREHRHEDESAAETQESGVQPGQGADAHELQRAGRRAVRGASLRSLRLPRVATAPPKASA